MSSDHVFSLVRMAENLYRNILLLTDFPIASQITNSENVKVNTDFAEIEDKSYDYLFATDGGDPQVVLEKIRHKMKDGGWTCWMPPRPNIYYDWRSAQNKSNILLSNGGNSFDAICVPNVQVEIGPIRDVIFSNSGVVSSVMVPNSGDGFWREIFSASGKFGIKGNVIVGKM